MQALDPLQRLSTAQTGLFAGRENTDLSPQQHFSRAVRDFLYDGSATIHFPVDADVKPVVQGWLRFLAKVSQEEKNLWRIDRESEDPDLGYIRRINDETKRYDDKEFFHFSSNYPELLKSQGVPTADWEDWIEAMVKLHETCTEKLLAVSSVLDDLLPGYEFKKLMSDPKATIQNRLRLLYYKQANSVGETIAKDHSDRNFMTFHLDESHPGLIIRHGMTETLYQKEENRVLMFPGSKAEVLTQGRFIRRWHGARAHLSSMGQQRWSVVFFAHTNTDYKTHKS